MKQKNLKRQLVLTAGSVLLLLIAVVAGTYAWFTFNAATRVDPISSTISEGDASLLISNTASGPFDKQCTLILDMNPDTLKPVSTADLNSYYTGLAQNKNGITLTYQNVTDQRADYLVHGTVYLQSLSGANDVYFDPAAFSLGADAQTRASLRLGMRIQGGGQTIQYLFRLDGMLGGTPDSRSTVPQNDTVVTAIDGAGNPTYGADPAVVITDYMAAEEGADNAILQAGRAKLCTIEADQVATVEYWIYLEGCDENCENSVQSKQLPIQLGFAGVPQEVE